MPNPSSSPADEGTIREHAYYLWEQDGKPDGKELEYWFKAVIDRGEKETIDHLVKPAPKRRKKADA